MKTSVFSPVNSQEFVLAIDQAFPQMSGTLYHRSLPSGTPCDDIPSMALIIEDILDGMDATSTGLQEAVSAPQARRGSVATFRLDVLFRQHNSWQGKVTWLEQGVETKFRSFLELILIMNDILADEVA